MLMRRFTVVCLLTALFGAGLAILVAEASRPTGDWRQSRPFACATQSQACAGQHR
ncbi:hypothetical protein [Nitratireductor sp. ZSWI3]|uniref:hypothetical protein n=1 Tax=Nitratireductor sp. ZSWI3 TaxID=2966359 RepID=UPI00214F8A8F|nr:hypothetical protein [Nitratireductor sp. ZSWI3]MCR4267451.1 hypothetical protein [Nitratireductor sp. ZSWI3]